MNIKKLSGFVCVCVRLLKEDMFRMACLVHMQITDGKLCLNEVEKKVLH